MAALIWKKNAKGKIIGRCDARCYNSKKPVCDCICGGQNHGMGLHRAIQLTAIHFYDKDNDHGITTASIVKQERFEIYEAEGPS